MQERSKGKPQDGHEGKDPPTSGGATEHTIQIGAGQRTPGEKQTTTITTTTKTERNYWITGCI